MTRALTAAAVLLSTTGMAHAVGLDRSNQDIGIIFEDGTYGELSFAYTDPSVSGEDDPVGSGTYDSVAESYGQASAGFKTDLGERVSLGFVIDQPYGADIAYAGDPATTMLGGTSAELNSAAFTALARYKMDGGFSVHGGVRRETLSGAIALSGLAYGGLTGYEVDLGSSTAIGYVAGVAYERPDIALRVALTYNSSITHEFEADESLSGTPVSVADTEVETPEAWNLDFQTGIAADTLVFGSVRYAEYSRVIVSPEFFNLATGGGSLTDIEDGTSYSLGIGRRFSDVFAGSVSVGFEPEGEDDLVSPLAPTNGNRWVQVGGEYTMDDVTFAGGLRYTMLGDARPETGTPDTPRARFEDNSAVSIGLSVGYAF